MNKWIIIFLSLGAGLSIGSAQTTIFSEDFESGNPKSEWESFLSGEDEIQAVAMSEVPVSLGNGGNYVGYLQDVDGSHTGIAFAVAGDISLQNYKIEADVYCYVNQSPSACTGLVVYADPSFHGSVFDEGYYRLVADFDADKRLRLINNQFANDTYSFQVAIDASGLYSGDGWHHMAIEVETLTFGTGLTCYFDGEMIGGGTYLDDGADQVRSGQFGVFTFQQDSDGIAGYFDNIAITSIKAVNIDQDLDASIATKFNLLQNYPNPFNSATVIQYDLPIHGAVLLDIYDISGRRIRRLVDKTEVGGCYSIDWDGRNDQGEKVSSGIYMYRLHAEAGWNTTFQRIRKMVLVR